MTDAEEIKESTDDFKISEKEKGYLLTIYRHEKVYAEKRKAGNFPEFFTLDTADDYLKLSRDEEIKNAAYDAIVYPYENFGEERVEIIDRLREFGLVNGNCDSLTELGRRYVEKEFKIT